MQQNIQPDTRPSDSLSLFSLSDGERNKGIQGTEGLHPQLRRRAAGTIWSVL